MEEHITNEKLFCLVNGVKMFNWETLVRPFAYVQQGESRAPPPSPE